MAIPVTVIIPAYQAEAYIEATLVSLANQSATPKEILVVNDGCSDGTMDIVSRFPACRVVDNGKNLGLAASLNHGIESATQPWIAFLDADDIWLERKLESQWNFVESNIGSNENLLIFTHIEQFISPELPEDEKAKIKIPQKILPGLMKNTLLTPREIFQRVGNFDTQWKVGDFVDWYARAKEHGVREHILSEVLVRRRIHRSNMGREFADDRKALARIMLESLRRRKAAN